MYIYLYGMGIYIYIYIYIQILHRAQARDQPSLFGAAVGIFFIGGLFLLFIAGLFCYICIICMLTLLLMPLAGLHICVGLDFVTRLL
jgi:hypothetical protein